MVALKAHEVDGFIARPDPAKPIVLIFGPDAGLVRERAEALIAASVDDPNDPFSLARLEGEDLTAEPMRLVEEAHTVPLFGGRRAVWVRAGSRNIAAAIEAIVAAPPSDCRVVIEAADLRRGLPMRTLCERSPVAVALPCYADADRDLSRLIDDEMRQAGLAIAPEARSALVPLLGGDRLASRNELRKLALYARGKNRVELDDVMTVVADASALALDGIIDATFAGRAGDLETQFGKARVAGTSPAAIISGALRQVSVLHKARLVVESGRSVSQALEAIEPPVHFRRKQLVEAALSAWTADRLTAAMAQLADATLETRRQAGLAEAIAQRTLLSICVNARRRR